MNEDMVDYEFDLLNPREFRLSLVYKTSNKFFKMAFDEAKKQAKKKGYEITGSKNSFFVPPRFWKILYVGVSKHANRVFKEVKDDGIGVVSDDIKICKFVRKKEGWMIMFIIEGSYVDNRGDLV